MAGCIMCKKQTIHKNNIYIRLFSNFVTDIYQGVNMYISSDFSRLEINLTGCLENNRYFR